MPDADATRAAGDVLFQFESLPLGGLDDLPGGGRVLILAPHPDDESLGCGGLIAEACAQGRPPVVVIMTDGAGSHPNSIEYPPARLRGIRQDEARAATAILKLPPERLHFLGMPDTAAPLAGAEFDRAVETVATLLRDHGCAAIAAPWRHDPHCDHEAADALARAVAGGGVALLSYPVWGWTLPEETLLPDEPVAGWRLDISRHMAAKQRAIAAHASQYGDLIRDDPTGFRLPRGLLAVFERPYEVFLTRE